MTFAPSMITDLADPSKFTTQMRRESKHNLVAHPSIRRHGTSVRFSDSSIRHKGGSTAASMYGGPKHMSQPALKNLDESRESVASCGKGCEVSVELESCVSSIELVQIQLDKLCEFGGRGGRGRGGECFIVWSVL